MLIFDFCMPVPIVRVIIIIEYTIALSVFYRLFSFDGAKHFCPVLGGQNDWNKFKTLIYVGVNIFVSYGFPGSLISSDTAFDDHNKIIKLIVGYLHWHNSLSTFLSFADESTTALPS